MIYYLVFVSGLVAWKVCKIKNVGGTEKDNSTKEDENNYREY